MANNKILIFDLGSDTTRIGFTGDIEPRLILSTPKNIFNHFGRINDISLLEKFISKVKEKHLQDNTNNFPVIVSLTSLSADNEIIELIELFFRVLDTTKLILLDDSILVLYYTSESTGLVVDFGHLSTRITPIDSGFPVNFGIKFVDVEGKKITEHLRKIINQNQYFKDMMNQKDTPKNQFLKNNSIIRDIKEKLCYVALDPDKEFKL